MLIPTVFIDIEITCHHLRIHVDFLHRIRADVAAVVTRSCSGRALGNLEADRFFVCGVNVVEKFKCFCSWANEPVASNNGLEPLFKSGVFVSATDGFHSRVVYQEILVEEHAGVVGTVDIVIAIDNLK